MAAALPSINSKRTLMDFYNSKWQRCLPQAPSAFWMLACNSNTAPLGDTITSLKHKRALACSLNPLSPLSQGKKALKISKGYKINNNNNNKKLLLKEGTRPRTLDYRGGVFSYILSSPHSVRENFGQFPLAWHWLEIFTCSFIFFNAHKVNIIYFFINISRTWMRSSKPVR